MTKEQLNNLIYFAFHFHETSDIKVLDCDGSYLMEKWDKYIGVKPKECNITYEYFLENKTYFHLVIRRWFNRWDESGNNWDSVLPIINFINEINLLDINGRFSEPMSPESLIVLFTKHIGDVNDINKEEYNSLHQFIKNRVELYLGKIKREYNLALLV